MAEGKQQKKHEPLFKSALSQFVKERDDAISKINRIINSDSFDYDVEYYLTEELRKLKDAQLNIQVTQQELTRIDRNQNKKEENQEENNSETE